jgi:CheY-like chemotaxis protein
MDTNQNAQIIASPESKKRKILVIDDDRMLLNMYARKLEHSGYMIQTADSAQKALDVLKGGFAPDLILADIIMPGMDGLSFVKEVKEKSLAPQAKIIMLTNESEAASIKEAGGLQVDGYFIKAVTIPSEAVTKIREVLAGKKIFADPF